MHYNLTVTKSIQMYRKIAHKLELHILHTCIVVVSDLLGQVKARCIFTSYILYFFLLNIECW